MKVITYILFLFLISFSLPLQAQTSVYRGQVSVKQHVAGQRDGAFCLDLDITLSGLSVGRYQSLQLIPMLKNGSDSLRLKPIVLNGANKQKMHKRALTFKGKDAAENGAYIVLKNEPWLLREISYINEVPFRPWMKNAELILVGEVNNYEGITQQTFINVLAEKL